MSAFSGPEYRQSETPQADLASRRFRRTLPTLGRRFLAWALEVSVLAGSIAGPFYLGSYFNQRHVSASVRLTPALRLVQHTAGRTLGLSPRSLPTQVVPLTNWLWSVSLGLPLILTAAHFYQMGRYGQSWPKQWLGVQVLALNGQLPGWRRSLLREGVGKWGGPLGVAYIVWQASGLFPVLIALGGLGVLTLVGESMTGLGNRPRRSWHDWLGGTCVVDRDTGAIIQFSSLWANEDLDSARPTVNRLHDSHALVSKEIHSGLTSVVLGPSSYAQHNWMQPSQVGLGLGLLLAVGGLAGIGVYHIVSVPAPSAIASDALYADLVSTLTNPELDPGARRTALLALGNLADDRVAPLLANLILQTDDPQWLEAIKQALVAQGAIAVPELRRLNQSLAADRANGSAPGQAATMQLQTVNWILMQLIASEANDRARTFDLSHLHLGYLAGPEQDFILVLRNQVLAGISLQGTRLNRAQLQGVAFFSAGQDQHVDTYDDRTTNLSGVDLTHADLTGSNLTLSRLVGSSLLQAKLNQAELTLADLTQANLERAQLIEANLDRVNLVEAYLANANLTAARLPEANLTAARLANVEASGAQMPGAILDLTSANAANFTDADLSGASLVAIDLTGARLEGANLNQANLKNANLRDADLRGVWLQDANLAGADLAGTLLAEPGARSERGFVTAMPQISTQHRLADANFSQARNLDAEQLVFICSHGGIHPACNSLSE